MDGIGLTVRHCYFHDNENGILTGNPNAGDILIEYSEFDHNGYGDGFSHNLYIGHVNSLTFRYNYSHHAVIGHNLKSRANENYILYNRIMDEDSGNSSRLIDLSNGGFSIIMGNLFMQGPNAENNNLVGYGKEGLSNTSSHELYCINNTFVNKRTASCIFVDIKNGTAVAQVANNIFAGTGNVINGITTSMDNNIVETIIENLHFVDEATYDYTINENSPAVDAGITIDAVNSYTLTPEFAYLHPLDVIIRGIVNTTIDAGAYEYGEVSATTKWSITDGKVYPNPTSGALFIDSKGQQIQHISIFNALGELFGEEIYSNRIDLSTFPSGTYYLKIEMENGSVFTQQVMRE